MDSELVFKKAFLAAALAHKLPQQQWMELAKHEDDVVQVVRKAMEESKVDVPRRRHNRTYILA